MNAAGFIEQLCRSRETLDNPVLLLAAHPDDDVLGAGGQLQRLGDVTVAYLTDGAPRNLHDANAAGFDGWQAYADCRAREAERALALAGIARNRILHFDLPDQAAVDNLLPAVRNFAALLDRRRAELILTHAYEGGHPDHDAASFIAHAACRQLPRPPRIVEMALYHADDGGGIAIGRFLPNGEAAQTIVLDSAQRELKRQMISCHASQTATLAPFRTDAESFRPAPTYDFSEPPHSGTLYYERQDWGSAGAGWRANAAAALKELALSGRV